MGNIIFIGMPAAGKSTVGVVLAKRLGFQFIDADIVIQEEEGKLLKEIIEEKEMMATCLRSEERQVFYQLMEIGTTRGITYADNRQCDIYELLNNIDTDIFEYEKEPLTLQEQEEVLSKIHHKKRAKRRMFSLRRYLKATELQLS